MDGCREKIKGKSFDLVAELMDHLWTTIKRNSTFGITAKTVGMTYRHFAFWLFI